MSFTKQQAEDYLREYYNDNYVSACESETFEEVVASIGDTLDMLSDDMNDAYQVFINN